MKWIERMLLLGAFAFLLTANAFGQAQVPNTFQAGQPARAADVNQNFSTLEASVNDNAGDIASNSAAIQANTVAINSDGRAIQIMANNSSTALFVREADPRSGLYGFRGLSALNYLYDVIAIVNVDELNPDNSPGNAGDLFASVVWFVGTSCTGQTFTNPTSRFGQLDYHQGFVFRSDDPSDPVQTYYVASRSQEVSVALASRRSFLEGGCVPVGSVPPNRFLLVLPNDPAVTGVPNTPFSTPVSLGH